MKTSQKGIDLIKEFESFEPNVYVDAVGVSTIGYGTALFSPEAVLRYANRSITEQEAQGLLELHLNNNVEPYINDLVKVELNQNQFDALASFIYNVGAGNFRNSTLLKRINDGSGENEIRYQFSRWNKGRVNGELVELAGLTRRRMDEQDLYFETISTKKKIVIVAAIVLTIILIYLLYKKLN